MGINLKDKIGEWKNLFWTRCNLNPSSTRQGLCHLWYNQSLGESRGGIEYLDVFSEIVAKLYTGTYYPKNIDFYFLIIYVCIFKV